MEHTFQLARFQASVPSPHSSIPRIQIEPHRIKRPHTKSRHGCFNCKARRVKCQETQPHPCANCIGRNMLCIYPSKDQSLRRRHASPLGGRYRRQLPRSHASSSSYATTPSSSTESAVALSSHQSVVPHTFTADDLRFFHHFLIVAYPHLPFGSEHLWKTSLPASAHECPHLMHAILCLGATHLSLVTPDGSRYTTLAVIHRGQALRTLGNELVKGDQCGKTELDLMLATVYALTFQANYMADGLFDFAIMVRGCGIITRRILNKYKGSDMFTLLTSDVIITDIVPQLPHTPYADTEDLNRSIETLENIEPLLVSNGHRNAYRALLDTYHALKSSARDGFVAFTGFYDDWGRMSNREFMEFLDPGNYVSRLLFLHYVVVSIMLRPVFRVLRKPRLLVCLKDELPLLQRGVYIYECLPCEVRGLVEWQFRFITLDRASIEDPGLSSSVMEDTSELDSV
ncbi:hypothetical protein BDV36DRAFT_138126 [Aspergillus pseudocaelatus]|uniref:Zn(2)-C6 fungal-type domain-containing protein n=1 Tax=Aspergillus pseudocaelatus TaxID=1825620 RepID=A0ABQ6WT73_9EURO|nr:hypothetical protein BDV36DRAFT_138126 [Aspergillus pseudocaelatus]